jgi:hypothetical protein
VSWFPKLPGVKKNNCAWIEHIQTGLLCLKCRVGAGIGGSLLLALHRVRRGRLAREAGKMAKIIGKSKWGAENPFGFIM